MRSLTNAVFITRRDASVLLTAKQSIPARPASRQRRRGSVRVMGRQSGVGLIEVLIAVLVLSIAFLGIAALQALSLSTSNSAMARSMATIASYSILDAMRADSANATTAAKYNVTVTTSSCPAAGETLATAQLATWCTQLGASLGTSALNTGTILCDATRNCTVTVQFDDSRAGTGGSKTQTVTTVAIL